MCFSGHSVATRSKMVTSADITADELSITEAVEPLPSDFDPKSMIKDPIPPTFESNGSLNATGKMSEDKPKREIVLGRNIHTSCLEVTEPDADDEVTGDREAYMASVLAKYRRSLMERTKHHLGLAIFLLTLIAFLVHLSCLCCCIC